MESSASPREQALQWWQAQVDRDRYVIPAPAKLEPRVKRYLQKNGYVAEFAAGRVWVLKAPARDDLRELALADYWSIVRIVMDDYAPAVIEAASAVRLHLDDRTPPGRLTIRHAANRSKYEIGVCDGFALRLSPGIIDSRLVVQRSISVKVQVPVDSPERTLLSLPLSVLRDHLEEVAVWLRSLVVSRPALQVAYQANPRPLVVKRLGLLAEDLGNTRLAEHLEALLAGEYAHRISRGRTGVGDEVVVPSFIRQLPRTSAVWLDRQAADFIRGRDVLVDELKERVAQLPRFSCDVVLAQAIEAKSYDAYHSTTLEGYRIRPEEVSAILRNEPVAGDDPEEVRSRMAIAGYGSAFERCLEAVRETDVRVEITENLISDLYVDLFTPSVEAGIVSAEDLRGYRSRAAFLRGYVHVPPNPQKVPALMQQYVELVNDIMSSPVVRAAMAHLDFVTIHPFPDGNGRIARFLMNLALVGEGLPWVTIRAEDRGRYFRALEQAQVGKDPVPLGRLMTSYAEKAAELML